MSNIHKRFPKTTTWSDLSDRLVKWYGLPHGSLFALRDVNGRIVRKDKLFSRRPLKAEDHPKEDATNVAVISERVAGMLAVNLRQLGWKIVCFAPSEPEPLHGLTLLATWRQKSPTLTAGQREAKALRIEEIESYLKPHALRLLEELDEGIEDAETKVPQAVIQALIQRYDVRDVNEAIAELRLYR